MNKQAIYTNAYVRLNCLLWQGFKFIKVKLISKPASWLTCMIHIVNCSLCKLNTQGNSLCHMQCTEHKAQTDQCN